MCFQLVSTRTNKWLLPAARSNAFALLLFVARAILHGHTHSCPKCSPLAVNFVFAASLNTQNINSEFYRIRWDQPSVTLTVASQPFAASTKKHAFYVNFEQNASAPHFPPPLGYAMHTSKMRDAAAGGPNHFVASHTAAITDTFQYCIYHKKRFSFL